MWKTPLAIPLRKDIKVAKAYICFGPIIPPKFLEHQCAYRQGPTNSAQVPTTPCIAPHASLDFYFSPFDMFQSSQHRPVVAPQRHKVMASEVCVGLFLSDRLCATHRSRIKDFLHRRHETMLQGGKNDPPPPSSTPKLSDRRVKTYR